MLETTRKHKFTKALSAAFPHTLPVLAGFLVLGIAYGMLMLEKGYGPQWSVLMSAVAFCGSMQFVAITLLTTAFQPLEALILSLLVNARHLFYGLSMLDTYKGFGKIKGFLLVNPDASFFHEFLTIAPANADKALKALEAAGILGGLPVEGGILWCATERNTKAQIDQLVTILKKAVAE